MPLKWGVGLMDEPNLSRSQKDVLHDLPIDKPIDSAGFLLFVHSLVEAPRKNKKIHGMERWYIGPLLVMNFKLANLFEALFNLHTTIENEQNICLCVEYILIIKKSYHVWNCRIFRQGYCTRTSY